MTTLSSGRAWSVCTRKRGLTSHGSNSEFKALACRVFYIGDASGTTQGRSGQSAKNRLKQAASCYSAPMTVQPASTLQGSGNSGLNKVKTLAFNLFFRWHNFETARSLETPVNNQCRRSQLNPITARVTSLAGRLFLNRLVACRGRYSRACSFFSNGWPLTARRGWRSGISRYPSTVRSSVREAIGRKSLLAGARSWNSEPAPLL
jgi:hypothetical protein